MALDDYTTEQIVAAFESTWSDKEAAQKRTQEAEKPTTATVIATRQFMEGERPQIVKLAIKTAEALYDAGVSAETAIGAGGYGMAGWMTQIVFDVIRKLEAGDELRRMESIPGDDEKEANVR